MCRVQLAGLCRRGRGPIAVRPATLGNWSRRLRVEPSGFVPVSLIPDVSFQSLALAVGQLVKCAAACNPGAGPRLSSGGRGPPVVSPTIGVGQLVNVTAPSKSIPPVCVGVDLTFGPPLGVFGVGHPTRPPVNSSPLRLPPLLVCPPSIVFGVGHEPESLSDVRCPDAASRDTNRPAGVAFSLQVSLNKVEPPVLNRCFNLLTKDNSRAALADEIEPDRPKVSIISGAFLRASGTERLARATACPNRSVLWPSGKAQSVAPTAESGEEMALNKSGKVTGSNILDAPRINFTLGQMPRFNQIA